jgi:hypothetical protein
MNSPLIYGSLKTTQVLKAQPFILRQMGQRQLQLLRGSAGSAERDGRSS